MIDPNQSSADVPARLGFGASGPWAERWFSEEKAYAVLRAGVDAGVTHIDTGPSYGGGNAEPRLGRLLKRLAADGRPLPRISSKIGTQLDEGGQLIKTFEVATIERQVEASLSALDLPSLDVLFLHGPHEHELLASLPILEGLKRAGSIKAIGVCADGPHIAEAAKAPGIDWIMSPYNAVATANGDSLRAAQAAGIRICVVAPLAQGLWRRDLFLPRDLSGAWYATRALTRKRDDLRAARKARWLRSVPGWSPAELALAFVRETLDPALILTTTTRPRHLVQSARALTRPIPEAIRARLQGSIVS